MVLVKSKLKSNNKQIDLAFCLKFMPFYHLEPNDNHKITEYFFPYEEKEKKIYCGLSTVPTSPGDPLFSKWGPDGDPNFSEMGTKWGPSSAEWGSKKPMFAKLIDTS